MGSGYLCTITVIVSEKDTLMFMHIGKFQVDLPKSTQSEAATAAAVQKLMGGDSEMSTLQNYMHQSFNMRGRADTIPFYDLVASITVEEFGHVELVAAAINLLQNGGEPDLLPAPASGPPSFDMGELREMTARLMKNM